MDDKPQRHGVDRDGGQVMSAWLASEAFTSFMTATFAVAVKNVVVDQAAGNMTQPR